ncbi:MAG: META domain-containing protein [Methanomicrobiales archaeon]|nr:META domain-containing protein [Methanomicrobiales archaeon]
MKPLFVIAIGMVVLALAFSGCTTQPSEPAPVTTTPPTTAEPVPPGSPIVGAWVLGSMTSAGTPVSLLPGTTITATFGPEGRLAGNDGCNQYSGTFTLSGSGIQVDPALTSTMMACEPPVMDQAQAYTRILVGPSTWQVSGDRLTIQDTATGKNVLVYAKGVPATTVAPAPSPVGSWDLTAMTVVKGGSSVVQNPSGTIYAVFSEDGKVAGSGGCNQFSGVYTTTGSTISVKDVTTTLMSCGNVLDTQENAFLSLLQSATAFENTATALTLTTSTTPPGKLAFKAGTAVATPIPPAIVGEWDLTKMTKNSAAISLVAGSQPTALFTDDGEISGLASCNQYSGSYVLGGTSAMAIGPLATTRMMCENAVMTQENTYLEILANAATWEVSGATGALTITDNSTGRNTLVYAKNA